MATATRQGAEPAPASVIKTIAELLDELGGIPPHRVLLTPTPGTATEQDVLDMDDHHDRLCELVDGVLVEKPMGLEESLLATFLIYHLLGFVRRHDLGVMTGEAGPYRVRPGQVRLPDVAFISRERFLARPDRDAPIADFSPDLAIEVLSKSNTRREMERKLGDYFAGGTRLVWYIDPKKRTVRVYTRPGQPVTLKLGQILDGGNVLPGFALPLSELFAELDRYK